MFVSKILVPDNPLGLVTGNSQIQLPRAFPRPQAKTNITSLQELHGLPWFTAPRNQYQAWSMRGTSSFPLLNGSGCGSASTPSCLSRYFLISFSSMLDQSHAPAARMQRQPMSRPDQHLHDYDLRSR